MAVLPENGNFFIILAVLSSSPGTLCGFTSFSRVAKTVNFIILSLSAALYAILWRSLSTYGQISTIIKFSLMFIL